MPYFVFFLLFISTRSCSVYFLKLYFPTRPFRFSCLENMYSQRSDPRFNWRRIFRQKIKGDNLISLFITFPELNIAAQVSFSTWRRLTAVCVNIRLRQVSGPIELPCNLKIDFHFSFWEQWSHSFYLKGREVGVETYSVSVIFVAYFGGNYGEGETSRFAEPN